MEGDDVGVVCPEDELLTWSDSVIVCGPAMDDFAWTIKTEDCDFLKGNGDYDGGHYESYVCASPVDPMAYYGLSDTAMPAEQDNPLIVIGLMLILGAFAAWRRNRAEGR